MRKRKNKNENKGTELKAAASHFETSQSVKPPPFEIEAQTSGQQEAPEAESEEAPSYATITPFKLKNAVVGGHNYFKAYSRLQGVKINAGLASGTPGCLIAPNIESIIFSDLASEINTPFDLKMAQAVSKVVGKFLDSWRQGFQIPNLPWYPMFNYFPGPYAPPMPNVTTLLQMCPSFNELYLRHRDNMIMEIMKELPDDMDNDVNRGTVTSFTDLTVDYFENWLQNSFITGQMGMGPIPNFRPPFSMGGPVMGGQVIPNVGVLS